MRLWQTEWEKGNKGRRYFPIQSTVKHSIKIGLGRRDSVVITRLRLGHCALNYGMAMVGKHLDGRCVDVEK